MTAVFRGAAAIALGFLIAFAGGTIWSILLGLNLALNPALPWSVATAIALLTIAWLYLSGLGWPRGTQAARRASLPQNKLSAGSWLAALAAAIGASGFALCVLLLAFRLLPIPVTPLPEFANREPWIALVYFGAASLVAGMVEEAAFRGYMLTGVERAWGRVAAYIVVAVAFAILHAGNPEFLYLLPLYFFLSLALSGVVTMSGSVWPGVVAHTLSDFASFVLLLFAGPAVLAAPLRLAAPDAPAVALAVTAALLGVISVSGFVAMRR